MNAYEDNPFFFFVDNAHPTFSVDVMDNAPPTFSMDVYPDIGKIIELSDTGCDARTPLASTGRRTDQNRPCSAKTLYSEASAFRDIFYEKEQPGNTQFNEVLDKKTKRVSTRDRTVPRNRRRSKTIERDNNEKVDQWERNIADIKNTLLRDQVNLSDDSSVENIFDRDSISENSRTYFSNLKNSLPKKEINRKSRKEEMNMNVKNEIREKIPDFAKNSNESRSTPGFSREEANKGKGIASATRSTRVDHRKRRENIEKDDKEKRNEGSRDFNEQIRRSIDRAVDKDSLSDNSDMSDDFERSTNENQEKLPKEEHSSLGKRSKALLNRNVKNRQSLMQKENSSSVKRSKTPLNQTNEVAKNDLQERTNPNRLSPFRETKNRVSSQTRSKSKSADFDKAKHRANMAKRYANKTWMKTKQNTIMSAETERNEISGNSNAKKMDYVQKNEDSRTKAVSKSAGSSSRKREDAQVEKVESREADMMSCFDDNADSSRITKKNVEERSSTNRTRNRGVSVSKSLRRDEQNNSRFSEAQSTVQRGIQKKDLEKLSAILISSTLKRAGNTSFSKVINKNDRELRKERSKSYSTDRNTIEETRLDRISSLGIANESTSKIRPSISNLSKLPSKTEKWVKSKIPVAISRLKKELEEHRATDNRDFSESPSRGPYSRSRTKSTMRENERVPNDKRIDESTSTGIISIDKSNCARDENNEIRSRLDEWSKKLEETRRKERDVELKVFKMARAQKEERKKEFEKHGLRESVKKSRGVSKDTVDIAAPIFEKKSIGKKSHCTTNYNDSHDVIDGSYLENNYKIRKESYSKPYSLRSSMYARYFPTTL